MARIENIEQLRAEIQRVEGVCKEKEQKLRANLQELKEDFNPLNIVLKTISSISGIKLDSKEFMKDGIGFGLSVFIQRLIHRAEKAVENKVHDFVDSAVEGVRKFVSRVGDFSEKRKNGMENQE